MMRITLQREAGVLIFGLEGKLVGPWVQELELCWRAAVGTPLSYPVRVDLSAVTFIDAPGKALLAQLYREGAELVASGCLNKCIVEEIRQSKEQQG